MKNEQSRCKDGSVTLGSHLLPVALHVSLLQIDIAVGDMARVARIRMRTRGRLRHGQGGLDARHDGRRKEKEECGEFRKGPVAVASLLGRRGS